MKRVKQVLLALGLMIGCVGSALAVEAVDAHHRGGRGWDRHGSRDGGWQRHGGHRQGKYFLKLGICTGQKLSEQGVKLPDRKPGEKRELDEATRKALWTNLKACRDEHRAARDARRGHRCDQDGKEEKDDMEADEEALVMEELMEL